MGHKQTAQLLVLGIALQGLVFCGLWGPKPAAQLSNEADLVILGTARASTAASDGSADVEIQVERVLKGDAPSTLKASLDPSPLMRMNPSASAIHGTGLWFLKKTEQGSGYKVLPLAIGDYTTNDAFLPLARAAWPLRRGSVSQLVLEATASWYRGLGEPTYLDDNRFFNEVAAASKEDAAALVRHLATAPFPRQTAIGLAIAIQLNLEDAVTSLAWELPRIQSDPAFRHVIDALSRNYTPKDQRSLAALESLVKTRSNVPHLDDAIASALTRRGTKEVLPSMATLLTSSDAQAQLRAARFFGEFSLFADRDGIISAAHLIGPWATEATRAMQPRNDSDKSVEEYSRFWLGWWAENRKALGFPEDR